MTIEAIATGGRHRMMGVLGPIIALVTFNACRALSLPRLQLIVRPILTASHIIFSLVHLVAIKTRHLPRGLPMGKTG